MNDQSIEQQIQAKGLTAPQVPPSESGGGFTAHDIADAHRDGFIAGQQAAERQADQA